MRLFIIAGHHNKDSGAVSGDRKENELTKEMRRLIVEAVRQQSPETSVWTDDDDDNLNAVISKVNAIATSDDILLDIHFNSASTLAKGTEALISVNARQKTKDIATHLCSLASTILDTVNRGVKLETSTRHKRLGILHSKASSVLWEVEFINSEIPMQNVEKWKHWLSWEVASLLLTKLKGE